MGLEFVITKHKRDALLVLGGAAVNRCPLLPVRLYNDGSAARSSSAAFLKLKRAASNAEKISRARPYGSISCIHNAIISWQLA